VILLTFLPKKNKNEKTDCRFVTKRHKHLKQTSIIDRKATEK